METEHSSRDGDSYRDEAPIQATAILLVVCFAMYLATAGVATVIEREVGARTLPRQPLIDARTLPRQRPGHDALGGRPVGVGRGRADLLALQPIPQLGVGSPDVPRQRVAAAGFIAGQVIAGVVGRRRTACGWAGRLARFRSRRRRRRGRGLRRW